MSVEDKLAQLGIVLPEPTGALANYVPYVQCGKLVSISGQIPMTAEGPLVGKVGVDFDLARAVEAARLCAIGIIAQVKAAAGGDLERVARIVRLGGFVNCVDGYTDQPKVINGASDLMFAVFGEKGRHSRSAVGVNALPLGVPVEIDALVELA